MAYELGQCLKKAFSGKDLSRGEFIGSIAEGIGGLAAIVLGADTGSKLLKPNIAYAGGSVDYEAIAKQAESIDAIKNPNEVIELLDEYKDNPLNNSSRFYNNLALAYEKNGKTEFAISLYEKSISCNPNNYTPYFNLGILYKNLGQNKKAASLFEKYLQLNKNYPNKQNMMEFIEKYK